MDTNNGFYRNMKFYCDIVCVLLHRHLASVKNKVLECYSGMCSFEKEALNWFSRVSPNFCRTKNIALVVIKKVSSI